MSSQEDVLREIEDEINETKRKAGQEDELEIEITDESDSAEEQQSAKQEDEEPEYGEKVQKRIKKLVDQRREAELTAKQFQDETAQLKARLERLEQGNAHAAENAFNKRYEQTKKALAKAVENGDTNAQVSFSEQLADMRAAMRIAEMQKQARAQQAVSPTVGRAQQVAQAPAPKKAMDWWEKNRWFNAQGFERETAMARSIDVQLDLEGYDKDSEEYYDQLNNRLLKVFPELNSGQNSGRKSKSRSPVAPTTGGSSYKGGRVRMSQDQLRMARELGITDEKGLKQYAAEIQKQARG
ncbi:MAG: hypothetical protein VW270_06370 [Candidatus Poseidoniales archaeon]